MRSGLDSATSTLYTGGAYDVHTRLKIENGSGTLISLENRYTKLSVRKPDPIEPIGSMQITLIRDSTISGVNQSLSPLVEGSDLNEDDAEDYSPLLQLGRLVTLDVNLTAVGGARPSDGDSTWYEIFRGIVGKVDWPDHDKGRITVQVDGLAAVLQHAKAESERTYLAGTSLETVVTQVLTNHGYSTIPTYFPAATSKVLPNDWAPGYQKTIWQQLTAIAQSMGWVVYYRYRGQNAPEITFFAPARTKTVADQTVEARDFKQLSLDDAEVLSAHVSQVFNHHDLLGLKALMFAHDIPRILKVAHMRNWPHDKKWAEQCPVCSANSEINELRKISEALFTPTSTTGESSQI